MISLTIKSLVLSLAFFALINTAKGELTVGEKLEKLRLQMKEKGYSACVILSEDEHQSEYVAKYDMRRAWLSGFTGSTGEAVVTETEAAVWADSRYYIQAETQLNNTFWKLMKSSESETPKIHDWLKAKLLPSQIVAQNAKFSSVASWQSREAELKKSAITLKSPDTDLIDLIWPVEERPKKPNTEIKIHNLNYTGKSWSQKNSMVQEKIKEASADSYVVTALDEVAWLFNLRASDIPYNPMFFAYAIINKEDIETDPHRLYINSSRITDDLGNYLKGIKIVDYEKITSDIKFDSDKNKTIWISPMSSFAIYDAVSNKNLMINKPSPIRLLKARKNNVELDNLRRCHLRDSAARIRHMYWLENEMKQGALVTEKTSADMLEKIQMEDELFRMKSFGSISAVGKNAAIVHYSTDEGENSVLTKDKIYLLDAGAQYEDCTTDITRTHHFDKPTKKEIFAYTRVLQGSINLANIVFPPGVYGRELDVEARSALWRTGLDYGHGTGHGIGYYLSVHESPASISYNSRSQNDEPFVAGMIGSDEPGYYEDGEFGIRLETDIESVNANTEYTFRNRQYLKFEPLNFVPFEKNLIDECELTNQQVDWLNTYNRETRKRIGPLLEKHPSVREYMYTKTAPFQYSHAYKYCPSYLKFVNKSNTISSSQTGLLFLFINSIVLVFKKFYF